ncbi:hypothetical protein [Cupriavidus taiwanensis]|uniref:hypothetical protein n=1 Tax=Cupriavidus taiwanensis TaxID=164546 RepID=UPI001F57E3CC|nr:hypothetical protein [Cupriavidus taiwanensis]
MASVDSHQPGPAVGQRDADVADEGGLAEASLDGVAQQQPFLFGGHGGFLVGQGLPTSTANPCWSAGSTPP